MLDLTVAYVVGGNDNQYANLDKSIRSLERLSFKPEIKIIEFGNKLSGDNVEHRANIFKENRFVNHIAWKAKYESCLMCDTEYVLYLDADTVIVNNTIERHLNTIKDRIGITQHFWVPTLRHFKQLTRPNDVSAFDKALTTIYQGPDSLPIIAGGIFLYKNSDNNKLILKEVLQYHDIIYPNNCDFIDRMTDEVIFSTVLNQWDGAKFLNGALNHCAMWEMPLAIDFNTWNFIGRNPFEDQWDEVTVFHCDTFRRDPGQPYQEDIAKRIRGYFYL